MSQLRCTMALTLALFQLALFRMKVRRLESELLKAKSELKENQDRSHRNLINSSSTLGNGEGGSRSFP